MPSLKASSSRLFDVAVVGGGPAGAATALALMRGETGFHVALVEQSDYSAFRVGETLPPPARRLLAELGVWDAFPACGAIESFGTRAVWGDAAVRENPFVFSPYGRGWHVDRRRFDAWLTGEAERNGVAMFRRVRGQVTGRRDDEWTVSMAADGRLRGAIRARVLVDASGRHSRVARALGARHIVFDALVAAGVRWRLGKDGHRPDTYTVVEACPDGWFYTATLPDGDLVAIFMTDAGYLRGTPWQRRADWAALVARAPLTAERLAGGTAICEPAIWPASSQRLDRCAGDGWLAVGDAAGTVDPLSSQGVMRALRSGIIAARAIRQHASGDGQALLAHDARLAKEYDDYLATRQGYYAIEQRWPESPFWRSRQTPQADAGDRRMYTSKGNR